MSNNKGIPTIGVRGIQFRSRIEAQWAYIFEKLEWNWEYEPIDLEGYIPDFIIKFDNDKEILIEIKGDTNIWKNYEEHKNKIINSGWKGVFGILGSVYKISEHWGDSKCPIIGKVCYFVESENEYIDDDLIIRKEKDKYDKKAEEKWFLGGDLAVYDICGGYWKDIIETKTHFEKLWIEAKNSVQWKGMQNMQQIKNKILDIEKDMRKGYVDNFDGNFIKPLKDCDVCNGSGISYWSDGIYNSCMECCFLCNDKKRLFKTT